MPGDGEVVEGGVVVAEGIGTAEEFLLFLAELRLNGVNPALELDEADFQR